MQIAECLVLKQFIVLVVSNFLSCKNMVDQCPILHSIDADNDKTYFVQAKFCDDFSLSAEITDTVKIWKTLIEKATLENFAEEANTTLKDYYFLLKSALTGTSVSQACKLFLNSLLPKLLY